MIGGSMRRVVVSCLYLVLTAATSAWPTPTAAGATGAGAAAPASPQPAAPAKAAGASAGDVIALALANPARLKEDVDRDAVGRPADILAFLGAAPGQHVIDVFSAAGYYTELLSRIVGSGGEVIAYNNPPYAQFAAKGIAARYAGDRLPNVTQLTTEVDRLALEPASLDAALFVMSYHDMYWRPEDGSWDRTDPAVMLKKLHAALKDGGVVVVQDHVANPGGDTRTIVDRLHRIDPAIVRRDFEAAGFAFDAQSDALAHPGDDHMKQVYDPAIRGKTDQFIYRFRKPPK